MDSEAISQMSTMLEYPPTQKQNFQHRLLNEIEEKIADGTSYSDAFAEVAFSWLGESEGLQKIDGKADRAFDYYRIRENEIEVFQCKSQDITRGFDASKKVGPDQLADIRRILEFFKTIQHPTVTGNRSFHSFRNEVIAELSGMRTPAIHNDDKSKTLQITINFVALADQFSAQAEEDFKRLQTEHEILTVFGLDVICALNSYMIDDLIGEKWKKSNAEWKDKNGKNSEWIDVESLTDTINTRKCLVAFVKARDLVQAYGRLGYQIFEANVRCEIKKSSVNGAIRHQLRTRKASTSSCISTTG